MNSCPYFFCEEKWWLVEYMFVHTPYSLMARRALAGWCGVSVLCSQVRSELAQLPQCGKGLPTHHLSCQLEASSRICGVMQPRFVYGNFLQIEGGTFVCPGTLYSVLEIMPSPWWSLSFAPHRANLHRKLPSESCFSVWEPRTAVLFHLKPAQSPHCCFGVCLSVSYVCS